MTLSANSASRLKIALADPTAAKEIQTVLDGAPQVGASNTFTAAQTFSADVTLGSGADLAFSGTTGQSQVTLTDNVADALSIMIAGGNDFIVCDSTDGNEKLSLAANASMKLGFFAVTPVVRVAALTQTYATATRTHAAVTTTSPSTTLVLTATAIALKVASLTLSDADATSAATVAGSLNQAQKDIGTAFNTLRAEVAAALVDILNIKGVMNAIVDDLQSYGLQQ